MQTVHFNDDQYAKISDQAAAAGYGDVAAFLASLADNAAFDARGGMSDEDLRQSAQECDAILDRMKREGGGQDFDQAWRKIGEELGFKPAR